MEPKKTKEELLKEYYAAKDAYYNTGNAIMTISDWSYSDGDIWELRRWDETI